MVCTKFGLYNVGRNSNVQFEKTSIFSPQKGLGGSVTKDQNKSKEMYGALLKFPERERNRYFLNLHSYLFGVAMVILSNCT